ncbi:MAG: hypothetical protein QM682_03545 [Paracoccus sp. (in: a-proteobacteria)]|uniref:WD40/YVTN/BNR-like repeat-containing protein n=1 Tax=Paracoccus sp. TaxID=267 RepID=UPI0039E4A643
MAWAFLVLLFLTVLAGLGYYLGFPFWQSYWDGRGATLEATLRTISAEDAKLDATRGELVSREDNGLSAPLTNELAPSGMKGRLSGHARLRDTLLIYGDGGAITRSTDGGAHFEPVASGVRADLLGHVVLGDILLIYGGDRLFAMDGAIIRSTDGGASFQPVPSGVKAALFGHVVLGDRVLIYGDNGAITRPTDGGANFEPMLSGVKASLNGHVVLGDRVLIYGDDGTIIRSTDGGESFEPVPSGVEVSLYGHVVLGDRVLIYGWNGTIIRSTDGGENFEPVPSGVGGALYGHVVLGDRVLIYGGDGSLVRFGNVWRDKIPVDLDSGAAGDGKLARFLDEILPPHLREFIKVEKLRDELTEIVNRRDAFAFVRQETKNEQQNLKQFPYAYRQDEQALEFESFMKLCRGDGAIDATLTEKCLAARESERQAGQSWWKTVADQVPPGIILMFLLATAGALYRYNVRLVGFHDSRADALEILSRGRSEAELRALLAATPGDAVNLATIFLAADKVEMGAIKAKLAQAELELAKTLSDTK